DTLDHVRHPSPIRRAADFEVPDVDGDVRLAADAERLVEPFVDLRPFIADMAEIDAAVFRGDARHADDLVGGRVHRRQVDERGGEAHGAVAHGLVDDTVHLPLLVGGGGAVDV